MPTAHLEDRALIALSGTDAEPFLQNIVTVDLDALQSGEVRPGALLTPQGKILFDFLVSRAAEGGLRLECRADVADDFIRRLMLYRLRAKVDISKQDQVSVAVSWQSDSNASQSDSTRMVDTRFPAPASVVRSYGILPQADADADAWRAFRIAHGVAESGTDYALGDAFPHDVLLDELGGVGFRKGCYVGQEVVSRMQHRGTARRRVLIVSGESALPPSGADITAGGRTLGFLGSVSGREGLAILRIDRVKDAIDAGVGIATDGVPVWLAIPSFAKFTFPHDAARSEDA
jgi:folate-binding protein YgfZ